MAKELRKFLKEKKLHPLVAWNRYFDLQNERRVTEAQFEAGMEMLHYGFSADVMFQRIDRAGTGFITLNDIDHFSADLWNSFKAWCGQSFTTADEMTANLSNLPGVDHLRGANNSHAKDGPEEKKYDHLGREVSVDTNPDPQKHLQEHGRDKRRDCIKTAHLQLKAFDKKQFMENSVRLGWYNSSEGVLFKALDINSAGNVFVKDITWFDKERAWQLRKNASRVKSSKASVDSRARVKAMWSRQAFLAFLKRQHSCLFQAWRLLFDKAATMTATRKEFFSVCRSVSWSGDLGALWHALDSDANGFTTLEELAPSEARALAQFKLWMTKSFGDSKAFLRALNTVNGTHTKLSKSGRLTKDLWEEACEKKRCPLNYSEIFDFLDYEGKGSVMLKNLKFLDRWHVTTEWLLEQPDEQAAKDLKELLVNRYKQPVKAWVKLIDQHHAGKVTWSDFKAALEHINFKGNFAAAWLALDNDCSGYLTLKEFDEGAAVALAQFRCWCDDEFGGVVLALQSLDVDESGRISFKEFRKGVKDRGFCGEIQYLWHNLDIDGRGQISPPDLFFLDDWELAEILEPRDLQDWSDSDNDSDSSDDDSSVEQEKGGEDREHKVTFALPEKEQKKSHMPQQTRRSLQPWPRINQEEQPPVPSGKRSTLLCGASTEIEREVFNSILCGQQGAGRTVHKVRPLHVQILSALRSGKNNVDGKLIAPRAQGFGRNAASPLDDTRHCLLQTVGWGSDAGLLQSRGNDAGGACPDLNTFMGTLCRAESPCLPSSARNEPLRCRSALGAPRQDQVRCHSARGRCMSPYA